jgi:uncharacterized protein YkwD
MLARRTLLGAAATLAAGPAFALRSGDTTAWIAYDRRLRQRLADAGGGEFEGDAARHLLALTNRSRGEAGVGALAWRAPLAEVARAHAADLAERSYVEHLTPEGFDPGHRIGVLARRFVGSASENIAYRRGGVRATPAELMGIWRHSPPHWRNLLNGRFTQAGFGVVARGARTYAVGLYSRPDGWLAGPAPFRLERQAELDALEAASVNFDGFGVSDPTDDRALAIAAGARAPSLPPGVYQLRPRRRTAADHYAVFWGPIFVCA